MSLISNQCNNYQRCLKQTTSKCFVQNTNFLFYADDTVIYCSASTLNQALCQLQLAFNTVQHTLCDLKLVLNADKTHYVFKCKI